MNQRKIIAAIGTVFIFIWSGSVVSAYYVVQKPLALQVLDHLLLLAWTLIVTSMLVINAFALGTSTITRLIDHGGDDLAFLILAGGLGLGELGLLGFVLAAIGGGSFIVLLGIQIVLLVWFTHNGVINKLLAQIRELKTQLKTSALLVPGWMRWTAALALVMTFLMTFLPPVEAYDALLYHLTVPTLWLRDGGLQAHNIPPYWFPGIVEGAFVWGLGLGTDIVPQQLHFVWAVLTALLLWNWSRAVWNDTTAWWVLMILLSMPSLPLLASWAYTDLALTFFGAGTLYTLWRGQHSDNSRWWKLAAIFTGMAMGIKYTSVVIPLAAFLLISVWKFREPRKWMAEVIWFVAISVLTGCIWYLRNWIWMGNPFYPFVFGGRYWDQFRADWYAGSGTGAGWNLKAILSLPLTITLNYQDITAFDGDIGPLFLLSLPLALWVILRMRNLQPAPRRALTVISVFGLISALFWTYGYVTTKNLWQSRLLMPAIIPFAIPASLGILSINKLDIKSMRLSFIVSGFAAIVIFVNLLDLGLSVIHRNPFGTATGIVFRERFMEQFQPDYAFALRVISQTPQDSSIYSLFEPRSYGASRQVQPDTLLDNFPHDIFLYQSPEGIINAWHKEKYTHILLNKRGANLILGGNQDMEILNKTISLLTPIAVSENGNYALYELGTP